MNTLRLDAHKLALAAQQEFRTRPYEEKTELAAVAGEFISQISTAKSLSVRETLFASFEPFVLISWSAGRRERLNGAIQLQIIYGLKVYVFDAIFEDGKLARFVFQQTSDLNLLQKVATATVRASMFLWRQSIQLLRNGYRGIITLLRNIGAFPAILFRSFIYPFFVAFQALLKFLLYDSLRFFLIQFPKNIFHSLIMPLYAAFQSVFRSVFFHLPNLIFLRLIHPFYIASKSTAALFASVINNIYKGVITSFSELVNFLNRTRSFFRQIFVSFNKYIFFIRDRLLPQYGYKLAGIDTDVTFQEKKSTSFFDRMVNELPPVWIKTTSGSLYENILGRVLSRFPNVIVIDLINFKSLAFENGQCIAQLGDVRLAEFERLDRFLDRKNPALIFLDCNVSSFAAHLLASESELNVNLIIPCLISGDVFSFGPVNPKITYLSYGRQGDRAIHAIAAATGVTKPNCLPIGAFFAESATQTVARQKPQRISRYAKRRTVVFCLGGDFIKEEILALRQYKPSMHPHLDLVVRFHPNVELQKQYPREVFESRGYRVSSSHGLNDLLLSEDCPLVVTGPSSSLVHALTGGFLVQLLAISGNPNEFDKIDISHKHHNLVARSLPEALNRIRHLDSDFEDQQVFLQSEYNLSDGDDPRFSYLSS